MMDQLKRDVTEMSEEVRHSFQRLQGRVFHAMRTINGANYMYRYRIGFDGKPKLEQKLKGIYITGQKIDETTKKLLSAGKAVPLRAQRRWREAVTGDPNKRIRDHMRETPQVKMLDKISFTMGVLVICFSEWLLLRRPNLFPSFYMALMAVLLVYRYFDYRSSKHELFLLDFCYFVNVSVAAQQTLFPDDVRWFEVNYVMCLGPVCTAIVVWHNSLVFHSLDKVTSFFLHVFPVMVVHGMRWKTISTDLAIDDSSTLTFTGQFARPFGAYLVWQLTYLFVTEVVLRERINNDPDLITSVRYLTNDAKNPLTKFVTNVCRKYNIIERDSRLDPNTNLAKVIFVATQAIYTVATTLHTGLLYGSYVGSTAFICAVFSVGVWNGASYYIEVFSKRYNMKFVDREEPKEESAAEESESCANSSVSSDGDADAGDFVEALESLDLSEPQQMKLYTELLEPFLESGSDSELNPM